MEMNTKLKFFSDKELDDVFFALSDKNRRKIISVLLRQNLSLTELANILQITLAGVKKHLKVLIDSKIIKQKKIGKKKIYDVNLNSLNICVIWIETFGLSDFMDDEDVDILNFS